MLWRTRYAPCLQRTSSLIGEKEKSTQNKTQHHKSCLRGNFKRYLTNSMPGHHEGQRCLLEESTNDLMCLMTITGTLEWSYTRTFFLLHRAHLGNTNLIIPSLPKILHMLSIPLRVNIKLLAMYEG